jgi:hypothetical protein
LAGIEQWAEVSRRHRVDAVSGARVQPADKLHRDTGAGLWAAPVPLHYQRKPAGSKLNPLNYWICELSDLWMRSYAAWPVPCTDQATRSTGPRAKRTRRHRDR